MNKLRGFLLVVATLISALLSGCGGSSGKQAATLFANEGHWESTGLAGSPVSFDIVDGEVTNFNIVIDGVCDVQVNDTFQIGADHILLIGEVDGAGNLGPNGIMGTFNSPTSISGTFNAAWGCGDSNSYTTLFLPSSLAVWSAVWQE